MISPKRLHIGLAAAALVAAVVTSGCTPTVDVPPPPSAITMEPPTLTLSGIGSEATVTAKLTPADAVGAASWRVENTGVVTVTPTGNSAVVRAVAAGTTRVFAKINAIEASATVTVVSIGGNSQVRWSR